MAEVMDYLKIAKEACSNIGSLTIPGLVHTLIDHEPSLYRDMALIIIVREWIWYIKDNYTDEQAKTIYLSNLFGRLWDTIGGTMGKLYMKPLDVQTQLVQDWWDGNEITLD